MALEYDKLKRGILAQLGINLHAYKEQQMRRRINQWVARHDLASYTGLLARIKEDGEHRTKFIQYLTINTSHFFRDANVFQALREQVLPIIAKDKGPRIWSAGASLGAEIYSVAIILAQLGITPGLLLATDLDEAILNKAKEGVYLPDYVRDLEKGLLAKYFTVLADGKVALQESIKKSVVFRKHDLLQDPFPKNFDLILCRNVFIYFTNETQKRLSAKFVQSLQAHGYFVVGSAEQILDPGSYGLRRVSYCIYQKVS